MDSVDQTKKTILKNVTTTKVVKSNKEELSNLKSIRQVFQGKSVSSLISLSSNKSEAFYLNLNIDSQRMNDSSTNRTPKRLLFSSSRANEYPNAKSKRKAEIKFTKSSKLKRSTKAKAKFKDINKKEKQDDIDKSSSLYMFALEETDRDISDFTIYQAPVKQNSTLHGNEESKGKNPFSSKRKENKIFKKTRNKLKFEWDLHEADHIQNLNHFKKDFFDEKHIEWIKFKYFEKWFFYLLWLFLLVWSSIFHFKNEKMIMIKLCWSLTLDRLCHLARPDYIEQAPTWKRSKRRNLYFSFGLDFI